MYDYEDYWEEPSEFDELVEEFKESLRKSVRDEIKQKIESLEKELDELKEFKFDRDKLIKEYNAKIFEAQNEASAARKEAEQSEKKWKKARLHQLLGDYLTVAWKPGYVYEYGEKCDKCDNNRKIHFVSPQGKEYSEDCKCATKYCIYFPQEVYLAAISVRKRNFPWSDKGETDFYNRYYEVTADDDYDRYKVSNDVYTSCDIDYEKINAYRAVFLNEEDCKKYCDWATEKSLAEMKKRNKVL